MVVGWIFFVGRGGEGIVVGGGLGGETSNILFYFHLYLGKMNPI